MIPPIPRVPGCYISGAHGAQGRAGSSNLTATFTAGDPPLSLFSPHAPYRTHSLFPGGHRQTCQLHHHLFPTDPSTVVASWGLLLSPEASAS